jgi:hypothetical protein
MHVNGTQLIIHVDGDDTVVAELVRRLVSAGIGVVGLEPERDDLETVFLELTHRGNA